MNRLALEKEIRRLRNGIRKARDEEDDETCIWDFIRLIELLPEQKPMKRRNISDEQMKDNCQTFISCVGCHIRNSNLKIDEVYEIWKREKPY